MVIIIIFISQLDTDEINLIQYVPKYYNQLIIIIHTIYDKLNIMYFNKLS